MDELHFMLNDYVGSAYSPQVEITETDEGHVVSITYMSPEGLATVSYTVPDWSDEEAARAQAEAARLQAEADRVIAEQARSTAEDEREAAEADRAQAEADRGTAFDEDQEERARLFAAAQQYRADTFSANEEARQEAYEAAEAARDAASALSVQDNMIVVEFFAGDESDLVPVTE